MKDPEPRAHQVVSEGTNRLWVRRASMIVVLGQGLALLASALLPTTSASDRGGLLIGAGVAGVSGALWFLLVPRGLFGSWRVFVAAAIALSAMLAMLAMTGGLRSLYFPYYLMPLLVMIMAGNRGKTITLGGLAWAGLVGLALLSPESTADVVAGAFALRTIELLAFTFAAAAASRAMGAVWLALSEQTRMIAEQARTDPLTGLGNRVALEEDLPRLRAAARRRKAPLSLVAIDIDGLKDVNDRSGHAAGDQLLAHFADVLRKTARGQDLAVRTGGDEFALLLPDTDASGAGRLIERIRESAELASPPVRFSGGIAVLEGDATLDQMMAIADTALYAEKAEHRRAGSDARRP